MDESNNFDRIHFHLMYIDRLTHLTDAHGRADLGVAARLNKALDAVEKMLEE